MTGTRKRYPASFKARVALEAAKQTKTLAELSGRYQVHSVQISQWKKQLLDGIESLFRDGRRRDHDESQEIQAEKTRRTRAGTSTAASRQTPAAARSVSTGESANQSTGGFWMTVASIIGR